MSVAVAGLLLAACSGSTTIRAASSLDEDNLSDGAGSVNGTVTVPTSASYAYTYSIGSCSSTYYPCAMALVDAAGNAVVLPAQHYGSTLAPYAGGGVASYADVTGTLYIPRGTWNGEAGFIVTIDLSCDGPEIALNDGSGTSFCPDGAGWSLTLAPTSS
jgi:hypothetical protein